VTTDRELLEWAARADGHEYPWFFAMDGRMHEWAPDTDLADATRLAIKLGISIEPYPFYSPVKHSVITKQRRRGDQMRESNPTEFCHTYGDNPERATCRAILMTAAEIGKGMTNG